MSKFTAGNWEVDEIYSDRYVVYTGDRTIADCFDSEANARLIAAAPKMYRLLADAAGVISQFNLGDPLADAINELLSVIDRKDDADDE